MSFFGIGWSFDEFREYWRLGRPLLSLLLLPWMIGGLLVVTLGNALLYPCLLLSSFAYRRVPEDQWERLLAEDRSTNVR